MAENIKGEGELEKKKKKQINKRFVKLTKIIEKQKGFTLRDKVRQFMKTKFKKKQHGAVNGNGLNNGLAIYSLGILDEFG